MTSKLTNQDGYFDFDKNNFPFRVLTVEANEKILSNAQWSSKYSFMMTNTLHTLKFPLNGIELKESVEKSIRSFNESKVCL